jgi:hypothetical protein
MNKRGNLITYDLEGRIFSQTGEIYSDSENTILPHTYPVGIPYIELPFGAMRYEEQRLIKINVTTEPHTPIFVPIVRELTDAEKLAEAEAKLRAAGLLE